MSEVFVRKTKELLVGKRPFRERLVTALFPALALTFTLFFFGPLDLSKSASGSVSWSALDILFPVLYLWIVCFGVLWLGTAVFGGTAHSALVSLLCGLSIGVYVQGAFLNPDLGSLDGTVIAWEKYSGKALVNLAIWALMMTIPFILRHYSRKLWRTCVILICGTLFVMQGVSLGVKLNDTLRGRGGQNKDYSLDISGLGELGKSENVLVVLLDMVSSRNVRELFEENAMLKDTFRDFTWFDDAATTWMYTFPSVINMMTGELYDGTLTVSDYVRSAWESDQARNFYDALKTAGYERRLYAPTSMLTSDLSQLEGYFDNVSKTPRVQTINGSAFKNLLKLSLYRYFPLMMKAPFWIYTEDIVPMLGAEEETFDPWTFVNHFHQKGMSLSEGEKIFSFIYTQGVHAPFYLDEEGKMVQGDVSSEEVTQKGQLIGHLNVLRQVFAQMRSLGVYDDATIIVLGDHGNRALDGYDPMPFFWIKLPHVSQSEIQVNHAPITIQEQLIPTIAELIGQSAQVEGESVFAITENEPRERCSRLYCEEPSFPRLKYERNNAFLEVCWEGDGVELERRFEAGEGILYPVKDVE